MELLQKRKQEQYQKFLNNKNKVLVFIYNRLLSGDTIKQIHKKISLIIEPKQNWQLYKNTTKLLSEVNKKIKASGTPQDANKVYLMLFATLEADKKLRYNEYKLLNELESQEKANLIDEYIRDTRGENRVFYLCSKHDDCAEDHLAYQGEIYIDEKWRSIVDKTSKVLIEQYVRKHNVKTLQWVTGPPVYMITRPNCRHVFTNLSFDEVVENSKEDLLTKLGLHYKEGVRQYRQTLRKVGDKRKDIENVIKNYKERLDLHNKLYKLHPCEALKADIQKDKFLINKWEKVIEKMSKTK